MRVLVDVSAVPDQPVGAGIYVINLARALAAGAELELHLLARRSDRRRWIDLAHGAVVHAVVPEGRPMRLAWEQVSGPRFAQRLGIDVWHGPHYTLPLRTSARTVVTFHDMTFFDTPEFHERAKVVYFQKMIRASANRADVIVAVSEATAQRVQEVLRPRARVMVAPHGVDRARFRPATDQLTPTDMATLTRFGVRPPFIAFLGTLEPRKNVPALVEAFARVAPRFPSLQLALVGQPGWGVDEVRQAARRTRLNDRIVFTGYAPDELVAPLFRRAEAVVYPSHAEGFGLPALEALACGAPLVTTLDSPMADVAGNAAVLVAPGDTEALANAIERILGDRRLGQKLREEGPRSAARFSWGACARAHLNAYAAAAGRAAA